MKCLSHLRQTEMLLLSLLSRTTDFSPKAGKLSEQHKAAEELVYKTIRNGFGADYQQEQFAPGGCNTADPDFRLSARY